MLTGQRPRLEDFRDGCFMPRPDYVAKVASKLREIMRPQNSQVRRKTPVLWITGGSGLGKSMLLLASSPTEYMQALKGQQAFSHIFEHHELVVEALTPDEQQAYARWVGARAGIAVTATGLEPNFVLAAVRYQVQMAGDASLDEFAVR